VVPAQQQWARGEYLVEKVPLQALAVRLLVAVLAVVDRHPPPRHLMLPVLGAAPVVVVVLTVVLALVLLPVRATPVAMVPVTVVAVAVVPGPLVLTLLALPLVATLVMV
jgi:hypothetical protein